MNLHQTPPLILASSSPARARLLKQLGLEFEVKIPDCDETAKPYEDPIELVTRLAQQKAQAVSLDSPSTVVIGADTIVLCRGKPLGKPHNFERAYEQLRTARGEQIDFLTGICLRQDANNQLITAHDMFSARYRKLSDQQIENYLHKEEPYRCAGSIKLEGLGISLIAEAISGDINTAIGLPLVRMVPMLAELGIDVLN